MPHRHLVAGMHFSPDRSSLVTVCYDRLGRWWSVPDGALALSGEMIHQDGVEGLAHAPRRNLCATAQFDGVLRIWHRRRPPLTPGPFVHLAGVDGAALTADGRHVAAVSRMRRVLVCDLATGDPAGPPRTARGLVHAAAFHPHQQHIVAACSQSELRPDPWQAGQLQCWNWRADNPGVERRALLGGNGSTGR